MRTRLFAVFTLFSLLTSLVAAPLAASAQSEGQERGASGAGAAFPVTGTGTAASGAVTLDGTFSITRFAVQDGKLNAIGRLAGTLTESANGKTTTLDPQEVKLPVQTINGKALPGGAAAEGGNDEQGDNGEVMLEMAQATPACNVLNLVLGPLHLNVLGLVVDLNQVVLNITGQTGSGNLLGNLVCAVAGLLDRNNTLGVLTNLLNSIVDLRRLGII